MLKKLIVAFFAAALISVVIPLAASASSTQPPMFFGFTISDTSVATGGTIVIECKTNSVVSNVFLQIDGTWKQFVSSGTDSATGIRSWSVTLLPQKSQTLEVYANRSYSRTNAALITIPVNVGGTGGSTGGGTGGNTGSGSGGGSTATGDTGSASNNIVSITSVTRNSTLYYSGDSVVFTVTTNAAVNDVWTRVDGEVWRKAVLNTGSTATTKTWTLTVRPANSQVFDIYANTEYKTAGSVRVRQSVDLLPANQRPVTAEIIRLNPDDTAINFGESMFIEVVTNSATTNLWVEFDGRDPQRVTRSRNTANNTKTWDVSFTPRQSQTITIHANTSDSLTGTTTRTLRIFVDDYYTKPEIISAVARWENANRTRVIVTVVTNDAVNFVKFDNGTTDRTYDRPNSTSSGQKTWTHTFSSMSGTIIYIDAGFTNSLDDDSLRIREILDPEVNVSFSITNSPSLINIGSSLTITVETSSEVGYIVVTDPTRNNQRTEVRDSTSIANNRRRFVYTGTPSITNQTSVSYTIEAYSGSGTRLQSTTRTVNVNR